MRFLTIFSVLSVVVYLSSATPIDPQRWLINRPTKDMIFRSERSIGVKGGHDREVKTTEEPPTTTDRYLRKGEYICMGMLCWLKPGDVPQDCNGICQFPLRYLRQYSQK